MQRNLPVANGGLLEVHLGASQQVVVNFKYAAESLMKIVHPVELFAVVGEGKKIDFVGSPLGLSLATACLHFI